MARKNNFWDAACVLWGHIPAAEYRKVIIGLILLRYVSAAFDRCYQQLLAEGEGFENDRDAYAEKEGVGGGEFYTPPALLKPLFPFSVPQQIPVSMIVAVGPVG